MALLDGKTINFENLPLILQLDVAGNPMRWITFEDSCYYHAKGLVAWTPTEHNCTVFGGVSRISHEQTSLTLSTIIAVKGKTVAALGDAFSPKPTKTGLFRRDQNMCAYCGQQYRSDELSRDHVIPQSHGGPTSWENMVTSCKPCNHLKGDRTLEQIGWQLLYVPYKPCRNEFLILQNRRILADQMDFLINGVRNKHSRLRSK